MEKINIDEAKANTQIVIFGNRLQFRFYKHRTFQDKTTGGTLHAFYLNPNDEYNKATQYYNFNPYVNEENPGDYVLDVDTKRPFIIIIIEDKYVWDWGSDATQQLYMIATTPIGETNTLPAQKMLTQDLRIETLESIKKTLLDENSKLHAALLDPEKYFMEKIMKGAEIADILKKSGMLKSSYDDQLGGL